MSTGPGDASGGAADRRDVLAVRNGETQAFGSLVKRYQQRLFNLMLMMLKSPENAEDITQDAFIRAYRKLRLYDENRAFYPWLATIAVRLAQERLRTRQPEMVQTAPEDLPGEVATPLEQLMRDESLAIWNRVAALPSGERTAVFLVYRQELTLGEAANAVGVSTGTIKTLLFRARKHLRESLDKQPESQS